ncbi:hypothetical protein [Flavobacterium piscisymbiosum]|uniref:Lipoprotein n=1 Tax=Flavobacterium piscisymbiosum TaxID=2893753 RepID=A0ABS8MKC1_9FLAO|nr:hypothetical protein [Flavobacterium sp. F-30]MCC9065939.1 hypothetical protein [Flavobacterium sp. F-30]
MYKKILLVILFLLTISCKDNCKNIENIDFSKDIEIMAESKQICDADISSAKWGINLKLEYDDDNFSLFRFNEKIKILSDKKRNINLCIKTNEVENFSVIYNPNDKFLYGINEIYFLDKNLVAQYSISESGSYKYEDDLKNKQIKYYLIDEENISFLNLDYKKVLIIYEKLKKIKVKNPRVEISPYYKKPYSWEIP